MGCMESLSSIYYGIIDGADLLIRVYQEILYYVRRLENGNKNNFMWR